MFNKKILITVVLTCIGILAFAYDMCYSIKCPACSYKYNTCWGCVAVRNTKLEYDENLKNHVGYRIYRCQHGHELHIPFDVKEDYTVEDIEVYVVGSHKKVEIKNKR